MTRLTVRILKNKALVATAWLNLRKERCPIYLLFVVFDTSINIGNWNNLRRNDDTDDVKSDHCGADESSIQ